MCGYSQVPGASFSENYSPIMNDITFCILLLMVIHFVFLTKIVDVELEEEICMTCPQGVSNVSNDGCIILNKCICGLIQAVRHYYEKAVEILKR